MKRKNILLEIAAFLWAKKSYWIAPVIVFIMFMIFLIIAGSSPITTFIYPIF